MDAKDSIALKANVVRTGASCIVVEEVTEAQAHIVVSEFVEVPF